jgi:hypothetical protein
MELHAKYAPNTLALNNNHKNNKVWEKVCRICYRDHSASEFAQVRPRFARDVALPAVVLDLEPILALTDFPLQAVAAAEDELTHTHGVPANFDPAAIAPEAIFISSHGILLNLKGWRLVCLPDDQD